VDFNLDETQNDLRTLAADLLTKEATRERLETHEKSGRPYDEGLWRAMGQAGLLGVCLPEEAGGAGLGPVEMAVVLREVGAHAAPVPALSSMVATLTLALYGTAEQRGRLGDGDVLAVALREPGATLHDLPATTATESGDGWLLNGRKSTVSYAAQAGQILVPADRGLFLVRNPVTTPEFVSTGEPAATLVLRDTPAERVGGQDVGGQDVGGQDAVGGLRRIAIAAIVAQASGVLAGALKLTTEYVRTRRQFGRALAEFQAVTVQIADVYVAARALDVAMWSGAWRLAGALPAGTERNLSPAEGLRDTGLSPAEGLRGTDLSAEGLRDTGLSSAEGLRDADLDLGVAAFHVSEAARALYTCQHLHGGVGLDVTYPLHRYFAHAKHLAHLLGGADAQLDLIGALV
jgi:alkylation response protein AidB-like acyl-CoA dehydrogenase